MNFIKKPIKITAFLFLIFFHVPIFGLNVQLNEQNNVYDISEDISFYEDKSASLPFEQIYNDKINKFIPMNKSYPTFGFTESNIWGKVSIQNKNSTEENWNLVFNFTMLDEIDLFYFNNAGVVIKKEQGNSRDFEKRDVNHRKNIFKLNIPYNTTKEIFFRISSIDTIEIPVLLMTTKEILIKDRVETSLHGIYYGIILVMVIYNLYIYFLVKEKTYIHYIIFTFLFAISFFGMDGFLAQIFFLSNENNLQLIRMFTAGISGFFSALFTISFLNLKEKKPLFYKSTVIYATACLINIVVSIFSIKTGIKMILLIMVIGPLLAFALSIALYKKYMPVRYYLWSWFVWLLGSFVYGLKIFNIYIYNVTEHVVQIGSAVGATVLSFGLAYRMKLIQKENEDIEINSIKLKQKMIENNFQLEMSMLKNELNRNQIDIASEIQNKMISGVKLKDIDAFYIPMEEVGGDFYNIISLEKNKKTGIFFSDVSGHGIVSSLYTAMVKSVISNALSVYKENVKKSSLINPAQFLTELNSFLLPYLNGNLISAMYCIFNHEKRELVFSSASHPPPIILSQNKNHELKLEFLDISPQGHTLGVSNDFVKKKKYYTNKKIILPKDRRLIFYSDGLLDSVKYKYENMNLGIESFANTPLYSLLKNSFSLSLKQFSKKFQTIEKKLTIEDDICVLILET
ncbi:MAG: SpoIIE family protein phosphatase [Spirochaetia bacterium]|nr:SpoIIE family protein phosphatase [Spirochaetia bacterium]